MHKIRVVPLFVVIVKEVHNNMGFNANWGFLGSIFIQQCGAITLALPFDFQLNFS